MGIRGGSAIPTILHIPRCPNTVSRRSSKSGVRGVQHSCVARRHEAQGCEEGVWQWAGNESKAPGVRRKALGASALQEKTPEKRTPSDEIAPESANVGQKAGTI